ncbi:hypothetical protein FACS18949_14190 [Clostridia bacterium]|nr:hypothetical protein FACS189425_03170 [Clostridia bacterium]GHV35708.1 hypothetical protein FACS18949_14190 [Clostridia bacterium]
MRKYRTPKSQRTTYIYFDENGRLLLELRPGADNVTEADIVKPAAELAWEGEGEQHAGEHCQFCKIKAECRERARANLELAKHEFKEPPLLGIKEIAAILDQADEFTRWLSDVKEYALTTALQGKKYPGYKLVEGRSNCEYTDEATIAARLRNAGYYDIFKEPKLLGLTDMTKLLGKATFGVLLEGAELPSSCGVCPKPNRQQ